jgi:hypothetical protein
MISLKLLILYKIKLIMQTVEIKKGLQVQFDDLIQGISRLNTTELTSFFEQLNRTISGQKPLPPIGEETVLLKKIKSLIPASVIRRFKELQNKQNNNIISEKEQEEILLITDFIEEKSAERVALLAALAKIRQVPLTELVKQFPLKNYHA